ncbi:MAG: hypothetical protein H6974_11725 [Gammaproteobacteria bacterium]|nr:hypothetical protein [Gammaproteobacteria bacterium]
MFNVLTAWLQRRSPSEDAGEMEGKDAPLPKDISETIERRVVRWFSDESPAHVELARATVPILVAASPRFLDATIQNPTPLAWLAAALDVLEAWPEPLRVPRRASTLAWRYLLFLRVSCEALEAAYDQVWQQGLATYCPLTTTSDSHAAAPRPLRPPRERISPTSAGLGALLIGLRLPEAGQRCVYEAMAVGVDWVHPTVFWAEFGIGPALPPPTDPVPKPEPAPPPEWRGASAPKSRLKQGARPKPKPESALKLRVKPNTASSSDATVSVPTSPSTPDTLASTALPVAEIPVDASVLSTASRADPLAAIAHAAVAALIAHPRFNRQAGDGWWYNETFYVAAKPFAEALQEHAWIAAQPKLKKRRTLYRDLKKGGLIIPHGGQLIWKVFVVEDGQSNKRYVSALKLTPFLYAGLELGPAFRGALPPVNVV